MRGRCDAALEPWEPELTVEKGTTESIAGCHCLCVDSCVHTIGIELCTVFLGEWRSLWSPLDREEADSAIRKAASEYVPRRRLAVSISFSFTSFYVLMVFMRLHRIGHSYYACRQSVA
jgi:hypothetical protein